MTQIEQQFGKKLPLATLFQSTTISEKATLLKDYEESQLLSPVVKMKSGDDGLPLFFISPSSGNSLFYMDLARKMNTKQPIYGLQAPGLNGEREALTTLPELAAYYIKAIKTIQQTGHYHIVGFCVAGFLAFEIAQQLSLEGETTALLGMIETQSPKVYKIINDRLAAESLGYEIYNAIGFVEELSATSGKKLSLSPQELEDLKLEEQLEYILEQAKKHNILPSEVGVQHMQDLYQVYHATAKAACNYEARPYVGAINLFNASQPSVEIDIDEKLGWEDWIKGKIEAYEITGDNHSIMREPDVVFLAEELALCLQQV
ncbi:MAG: thioesterase domain-containing protein [Cyanobacteria bacterium P01_H01_bin.35]